MPAPDAETRVLYNADCPVCRFEIDHYRKVAARDGLPLRFDDLNGAGREAWGIDADRAAQRLHVAQGGEVHAGFPAFLALWAAMPRMRWLARIGGLPGMRHVMGPLYDRVAAPLLYRGHVRRQARRRARA
jgi:predicted DCC family thiol-disulfide oxidoreductase YuxK